MAFDDKTGLPNPFLHEQLLQDELGSNIESQLPEASININILRLGEVFGSKLYKKCIDENWSPDTQLSKFLETESPYVAITRKGEYLALISQVSLLNEIVRSMVTKH